MNSTLHEEPLGQKTILQLYRIPFSKVQAAGLRRVVWPNGHYDHVGSSNFHNRVHWCHVLADNYKDEDWASLLTQTNNRPRFFHNGYLLRCNSYNCILINEYAKVQIIWKAHKASKRIRLRYAYRCMGGVREVLRKHLLWLKSFADRGSEGIREVLRCFHNVTSKVKTAL